MPRIYQLDIESTSNSILRDMNATFFNEDGTPYAWNDGAVERMRRDTLNYFLSRTGTTISVNPGTGSNQFSGETIVWGSVPSYEPLITEWKERNLPSNAPFAKRVRNGEVVLSNCDHGHLEVKSYPGRKVGAFLYQDSGRYPDGYWLVEKLGWTEKRWWGRSVFCPPGSSSVGAINIGGANTLYAAFDDFVVIPPLQITAEAVAVQVKNSMSVPTDTVTSAVSEANKRTLDALTALAETPETIRSFAQLIGQVANIVKGVKKRQFSLTQSFRDRKKYLSAKRTEDLVKIDNLLAELNAQASTVVPRRVINRRRKLLERDRVRTIKSYERAQRKAEIELGDALSHVWMNFRYNIMPLVYTAVDIANAYDFDPEFLTVRKGLKSFPEIILDPDLPSLIVDTQFLVFIKDRAKSDVGPFSLTTKVVTGNLLTTAWELVPLSFVVDWFINIGDFITAISGGSTADRNSTISFKRIVDYNQVTKSGQRLVITGQLYNRSVTHSLQQYTCLTFEPDWNPKRQLDSLALFWNAIRGDLKRSIK